MKRSVNRLHRSRTLDRVIGQWTRPLHPITWLSSRLRLGKRRLGQSLDQRFSAPSAPGPEVASPGLTAAAQPSSAAVTWVAPGGPAADVSLGDPSAPGDRPPTPRHPLDVPTIRPPLPPPSQRPRWSLRQPLALIFTVTTLTGLMGQRFYNQPGLDVGRRSPTTILASESATVEDVKSTEEKRKAARTGSIPVLKVDSSLNQQIYTDLQRWVDQGQAIRQALGPFPPIPFSQIPASVQLYLRDVEESIWLTIVETVNRSRPNPSPNPSVPVPRSTPDPANTAVLDEATRAATDQAIAALTRYRNSYPTEDYVALLRKLFQARENYQLALQLMETERQSLTPPLEDASSTVAIPLIYKSEFLQISDQVWQETQQGIYRALERILTQGIAPGVPSDILDRAVRVQVKLEVPAAGEPLAVDLLGRVLQPNLIQDADRTKLMAEQAADAVEPVYVTSRQGEPIVKMGDEITQAQFVLLDHFNKSERSANVWGLVSFGLVVTLGTGIFVLVSWRCHPKMRNRDRLLVMFFVLSTPLLALSTPNVTSLEISSLPAVGILMGSFYGSTLGSVTVGVLAVLLPLGLNMDPDIVVASAASGLVAAQIAGRLRSREELALLGAGVGLTQALVQLLLSVSLSAAAGPVWSLLLKVAAVQGLQGLAWCVVALGLSPYLEHLFDLVTPIRLAELSSPNRPLLQRLALEAPGTFQHTLFVATLAEAAARALRCNVELVRAGTLYHDIGKMHDPEGFIENQMGGANKHDQINDPWRSADIIKKHVSEGLVMAKRCRLPKAIKAFIPEHQGTMLIAYFHHQAQQLEREDPANYGVNELDFRYPGPIPQSRETGIVMLADSCEAALRSLKDATPEAALAMVRKIVRGRWQDQQLVESGLKREEMDKIAETFVQIWQQFHHKRISYPAAIGPALAPPVIPGPGASPSSAAVKS
ncbi:HD family phosphohydrolase [Prochlorothrix hollandica]|uniref:HD family phosphohydrolase n=1 Tax=Prochlorothrix hollandica TaxID=1223 RepID=UPI0011D28461|nr:HDIG domain-containing metalloprotein [Prochlorothrix hollandica]